MKRLYNSCLIIFLLFTPLENIFGQYHRTAHTCSYNGDDQKWKEYLKKYKNSGAESLFVEVLNRGNSSLCAKDINGLEALRVLFLSNLHEANSSTHFMEEISNPGIEVLYLVSNRQNRFPTSLSGWSYLDTLIMRDNSLGVLYELNKASSNNIQKYSFSDLQDTLKKYKAPYCEGLEVLADLRELKYAKLSTCYLPENIHKNKELQHIEIQSPNFYFIPKTIIGLDKLHTFEVITYYLKQIPAELFELGSIQSVVISANKVADFPSIIKGANLQNLVIKVEDFTDKSLRVRLKQLPKLKSIAIAYPDSEKGRIPPIRFSRLSALDEFSIEDYPYDNLSFKSKIFPVLKTINISESPKIKSLSTRKIDGLEYLNLDELENLEKISLSKKSCKKLQELYIDFTPKLLSFNIPASLNNIRTIGMYESGNINWTTLPEMGETLEEIQLDTLMMLKGVKSLRDKPNLKRVEMKIMSHQKGLLMDLSYLARTSSAIITVEMPNLFVDEFIRSIDQSKKLIKTWSIGDNASGVFISRRE